MTEDEMQRKMEFIVEQQAQFSVDIQLLKEAHKQAEARMEQIESVMLRLANAQVNTNEQVSKLVETQIHAGQQMAELREAQAHTDQRLSALIDIVNESRGR